MDTQSAHSASSEALNELGQTQKNRFLSYESWITVVLALCATPVFIIVALLLWHTSHSVILWIVTVLALTLWIWCASALRAHLTLRLRTVSNLLSALREGDYSLRAAGAQQGGALGEVMIEFNALADALRGQRLGAVETHVLLRKLMAEIDVAVFTVDEQGCLRMLNRNGERLLGCSSKDILLQPAAKLGLQEFLHGETPRIVEAQFPGGTGRWELRRGVFRENGLPHHLILLSDMTRMLHEQERQAWDRLLRVLRHEVNNSLAPIHSIAASLQSLLNRGPRPKDWLDDLVQGLEVIASRSEALRRFIETYSTLTHLPTPRKRLIRVGDWVEHVLEIETRTTVMLRPGPDMMIFADSDQLEQLLINVVRNAVDAITESGDQVEVSWTVENDLFVLWVDDNGPGLGNVTDVFVPFFTTKPTGAGIGLALSRQIAEAHSGTLTLENHLNEPGCRATFRLPLSKESFSP